MNSKRILALVLALVLSLAMTTGSLAGNVVDELQRDAQETPIASVSENGVTIEIKNAITDKHCVYILYEMSMPEDINSENEDFWISASRAGTLNTETEFKGHSMATGGAEILGRKDNSMTVLMQHYQEADISGKKASLEFEDLGYLDLETLSYVTLVEGSWNLEFDLKFEDTIDLQPNTEVTVDGVTATLETVSISPLSIYAAVTIPGQKANEVMQLSPAVTFKDGSKTSYDSELEKLSGRYDGSITTMSSSYLFEDSVSLDNIESITLGDLTISISNGGEAPTESPSDWAKEQVSAAVDAGIVPSELLKSYTEATTRAEFCALAVSLYETVTDTEITDRKQFSDTDDINVQKMAGLDIAQGVGDGIFAPDRNLTREQAATLLARLAAACNKALEDHAPEFSDNSDISPWAAAAVGQVQKASIMSGIGENRFAPQADYTREQSIMTMMRLFTLVK